MAKAINKKENETKEEYIKRLEEEKILDMLIKKEL